MPWNKLVNVAANKAPWHRAAAPAPEVVPISDAEPRVMASRFTDELDEILGPRA